MSTFVLKWQLISFFLSRCILIDPHTRGWFWTSGDARWNYVIQAFQISREWTNTMDFFLFSVKMCQKFGPISSWIFVKAVVCRIIIPATIVLMTYTFAQLLARIELLNLLHRDLQGSNFFVGLYCSHASSVNSWQKSYLRAWKHVIWRTRPYLKKF